MKTVTNLRPNHNEMLTNSSDTTRIYATHFAHESSAFEQLAKLLSGEEGCLTLKATNDTSWFSHTIELNYKHQDFILRNDEYTGKFYYYIPNISKFRQANRYVDSAVVDSLGEVLKKPLNYSFNKLTTKKLCACLNYAITEYVCYSKKTSNKEKMALAKYEKALEQLKVIGKVFAEEIQETVTGNKNAYCYIMGQLVEVKYDDQEKYCTVSSNLEHIYAGIFTIKKYFTQR